MLGSGPVNPPFSAIIPFTSESAADAASLAARLGAAASQVIALGPPTPGPSFPPGVACVQGHHQGEALHEALSRVKTPWVVLQDAGVDYTGTPWPLLLAPLTADQADAVYAAGNPAWDSRALGHSVT